MRPLLHLILFAVSPLVGQERSAPLSIEAEVSRAALDPYASSASPDGKRVSYVATKSATNQAALHVVDAGTGSDVVLEEMPMDPVRSYAMRQMRWSPDGERLVFPSKQSGDWQVLVWSARTQQTVVVSGATPEGRPQDRFWWSPDSRTVFFRAASAQTGASEGGHSTQLDSQHQQSTVTAAGVAEPQAPSPQVFRSAARLARTGNTSTSTRPAWTDTIASPADLVGVDLATRIVRRIVQRSRVASFALSPDGAQLAYLEFRGEVAHRFVQLEAKGVSSGSAGSGLQFRLVTVSLRDGAAHVVADSVIKVASDLNDGAGVAFSSSGTQIAYTDANGSLWVTATDGTGRPERLGGTVDGCDTGRKVTWDAPGLIVYSCNRALLQADPVTRRVTPVVLPSGWDFKDLILTHNATAWHPQGPDTIGITVVNQETEHEGLAILNLRSGYAAVRQNEANHLLAGEGRGEGATAAVTYIAEDAGHPFDIWERVLSAPSPRQLTHVSPALEGVPMGSGRLLRYTTSDGQPLQASVLLPPDYKPGLRYPTVLRVYAGGMHVSPVRYAIGNDPLQLFATRGYVVVSPDMPVQYGAPVQDIIKTAIAAVDAAVREGLTDPARVGVMGWSHGGYTTMVLATFTQKFKAAVEIAGSSDLVADSYGNWGRELGTVQFAENGQLRMGVAPWEDPQRYIANSPFYSFDKLATPLLILHGTADGSVLPQNADQAFQALARLNKEVEYVRYPGAGHGIDEYYAHRVDLQRRRIAWFDEHLKGALPSQDGVPRKQ